MPRGGHCEVVCVEEGKGLGAQRLAFIPLESEKKVSEGREIRPWECSEGVALLISCSVWCGGDLDCRKFGG